MKVVATTTQVAAAGAPSDTVRRLAVVRCRLRRSLTAKVPEKVTPKGPKSVNEAHCSAELLELVTGTATDAPLCMTCGTKMRPAGSCYVREGCGSTSGCS